MKRVLEVRRAMQYIRRREYEGASLIINFFSRRSSPRWFTGVNIVLRVAIIKTTIERARGFYENSVSRRSL